MQILKKLNQAVVFEQFLDKKFVGQKRFSLQGAETLIPALDSVVEKGAELGIDEFIFGMAHRGRLNVLANIFYKTYKQIFSEFESLDFEDDDRIFDGDVKYHLGYTCDIQTDFGKNVKLTLAPNPSHLEAVDPVVEGIARAKIDAHYNNNYNKVCPILIHGDAAVAGQGIVYEVASSANGLATSSAAASVSNDAVTEFEVKIRVLRSSYADLIKGKRSYPLKPGMTASVEIVTDRKNGVLSVALAAVTTRDPKAADKEKKSEEESNNSEEPKVIKKEKLIYRLY